MNNTHEDFDKLVDSLPYEELERFFSKMAIEHMIRPRNNKSLTDTNGHARVTGPCGDTVEMWVKVEDSVVKEATFITNGCRPVLACSSMTTTLAKGKTVAEAVNMSQQDILDAFNGFPEETQHCALLAVKTLKEALGRYIQP